MLEAIYEKWKIPVIYGDEKPKKPAMIAFNNTVQALEMIYNHLNRKSKIAIHCDVDMDGIGSGYILKRMFSHLTSVDQFYFINKEKEHGIKYRHVQYFDRFPIDLLIVVDSSSNELETIKKFRCDVLVIDHHDVSHGEYSGFMEDGEHRFIIVNNVIDNPNADEVNRWIQRINPNTQVRFENYVADTRMSCGLVIYELLRVYQEAYKTGPILENTQLYQWAGVTLFTDSILLANERNQWYIENTVHSLSTEPTLFSMIKTLNEFNFSLTKSNINYSLAPTINKAIRAGASGEALSVVMRKPDLISLLNKYKEMQENAINLGTQDFVEYDSFVLKDLTNINISPNYSGVIAGKLCDMLNKNAVVYHIEDGIAIGSFRGRSSEANYREKFESFNEGIYAQGHGPAFGFKAKIEDLVNIMASLKQVENEIRSKYYLTAGDIPPGLKGTYHIEDMDAFKKSGGIMRLAIGNSKVSSSEQIMITVPASLAKLEDTQGKVFIYNVLGLSCKAFSAISGDMINIYPEYTKSVDLYIK